MKKVNAYDIVVKSHYIDFIYIGGVTWSKNRTAAELIPANSNNNNTEFIYHKIIQNPAVTIFNVFDISRDYRFPAGDVYQKPNIKYIIDRQNAVTKLQNDSFRGYFRDFFYVPALSFASSDSIRGNIFYAPSLRNVAYDDKEFPAFNRLFLDKYWETQTGDFINYITNYANSSVDKKVIYIQNYTKPNDVVNHTISNITATSFKITVTPPTHVNSFGYLEIWINGFFQKVTKGISNQIVDNVDTTQIDYLEIILRDEYFNASKTYKTNF